MFHGICADILDAKWLAVSELEFPLNAKKIAATDCLNADLRQFFFAEINHYSRKILQSLATNTNISPELSCNSDGDAITNILYDWVEFSSEETHNLLKVAIDTEIFFLISPARCLVNFLFNANDDSEEQAISNIIKELDFVSDKQEIITALKNELEELSNVQKDIARNKFASVVNDITFNLYQKQSIEEFLLPCQHYLEFSANESIPIDFVELFLLERDLTGVLTEFRDFAITNEKQALSYEELYNEIGKLTGKLPENTEENAPVAEEDFAENEAAEETTELPEEEVLEEIGNNFDINEEATDAVDVEEVVLETEEEEEISDFNSTDVIEEAKEEEETTELPEEEVLEEMENNFDINEEATDAVDIEEVVLEPEEDEEISDFDSTDVIEEITELPEEEAPAVDITEEDFADAEIEEDSVAINEEEIDEETVDSVSEEVEETLLEKEPALEEDVTETDSEIVVPEDFEEFAETVEQEVDNAIAELDKEDIIAEPAEDEIPKPAPVVAPLTPAMQEVIANSNTINSKMAEMRSHYINSKVAEMRSLGKTLFEIEHNYLEMETEYVAKILNLLKE